MICEQSLRDTCFLEEVQENIKVSHHTFAITTTKRCRTAIAYAAASFMHIPFMQHQYYSMSRGVQLASKCHYFEFLCSFCPTLQ